MALNIPVGISNFTEIRSNNYYYVDKTNLIYELLQSPGTEVTMITRPRRFGKTLAMSMLESFFDIRKASKVLFEGLDIMSHQSLCEEWMNKWPVIFVSFRQVDGLDFDSACAMLSSVIAELFNEHLYLLDDERITEYQRKTFRNIAAGEATQTELKNSLRLLTTLMNLYYDRQVILLIDEYDVPIAKANAGGYYRQMLDMMKGLMQALKDNCALKFAVVTGCLKIAKESIFTGTNNFVSDSVADSRLTEYFGFVQSEVDEILKDADIFNQSENIRKWYDGYHFGDVDVYCPWDVMNYVLDLQRKPDAKPLSYWKNTSDNAIIRSFIDYAGSSITQKLETLLSGGYIVQQVDENLTYDYLHSSEENLWSILYLTGYLTSVRADELENPLPERFTALTIPNEEIREIYETTVIRWFDESAPKWNRSVLFDAVWKGNIQELQGELNRLLRRTISYHDYKEDFYHAFLAGIFAGAGYMVESNKEYGDGRSDVVVKDQINGRVAVFEAKYTRQLEKLENECDEALKQIENQMYAKQLEEFLHQYEKENGEAFDITIYSDGDQIVNKYQSQYDIILMDVEMKFMDGMSAAEEIRKVDTEVVIIFITNMAQYAIRGYAVDALDYVLKPVSYFAFSQRLSRAIGRMKKRETKMIMVSMKGGTVRINIANIYYIESQGHTLILHTILGDYETTGTMKEMEEKLADMNFCRGNKGYLINLAHVDGITDGCAMVKGERLVLSRARKKEFMEELTKYWGEVIK